jgi:hypothetical protein
MSAYLWLSHKKRRLRLIRKRFSLTPIPNRHRLVKVLLAVIIGGLEDIRL